MRLDIRVPGGKRLAAPGVGEPTVGRIGRPGRMTTRRSDLAAVGDGGKLERTGIMRGDTVHFDIIDRDGNMISSTPSGGWLQSSPTIPELGFCLGSRAQQFWLEEGHPNAIAPGKRPRITLSPTMALRDGEPYLAWGSPGGDQQDQWVLQMFLRHVHCGMNLQEAIDAPAWHTEHFPSSFWPREARPGVLVVEGRLPPETIKELGRRGHKVEVGPGWSEGRLTAASREGRPQGRRQSARHAGLRRGAVGSDKTRGTVVRQRRGAASTVLYFIATMNTSATRRPPGPKGLPLLGNLLEFRRDLLRYYLEWSSGCRRCRFAEPGRLARRTVEQSRLRRVCPGQEPSQLHQVTVVLPGRCRRSSDRAC